MGPTDIADLLHAEPFRPFRLVTSRGTTYEIRHPEMVIPSFVAAVIAYPDPKDPRVASRYDIVSMLHIVSLEPIESAPAAEIPPPGQGG
jgi:hypothetical protein